MQTFTFIGVSTAQSAATRLFPAWTLELGLGDVRLVGCDLPLRAGRERYRGAVAAIKSDTRSRGALVTSHKIDLYEACRDMFDAIDPDAELCGEVSAISRRDGALIGFATDPTSSRRALDDFHPRHVQGEVLCLGAGGAATAITVGLLQRRAASLVTVADTSPAPLARIQAVHQRVDPAAHVRYVEVPEAAGADRLVAELPPGSLVINATGLGKDRPGSPLSDEVAFPQGAYAWDLNYRGDLRFVEQARRQQASRKLIVEDGWRYFIHGWAAVISRAFDIEIGPEQTARMAAVAAAERPER